MKSLLVWVLIVPMIWMGTGCENHDVREYRRELDEVPVEVMAIVPEIIHLGTNTTHAVLEVTGGAPPFSWTMSDPTLGFLSGTNSTSRFVNYESFSTNRAVNSLRVEDSRQASATALIVHGD